MCGGDRLRPRQLAEVLLNRACEISLSHLEEVAHLIGGDKRRRISATCANSSRTGATRFEASRPRKSRVDMISRKSPRSLRNRSSLLIAVMNAAVPRWVSHAQLASTNRLIGRIAASDRGLAHDVAIVD